MPTDASATNARGLALERLAGRFAVQPRGAVLDEARLHLYDTLVAALAGTMTPEGQRSRALRGDEPDLCGTWWPRFGLGDATIATSASLMGRLIRTTEIDDLQLDSCTTPGAVVVPAALAVAGLVDGASASALLSAVVVGYEVIYRFGLAVGGTDLIYRRGGWPTLAVAAVGAAATAATMLGLERDALTAALALGLTSTPAFGAKAEEARLFSFGVAVAAGVDAALAARDGRRGDVELLERAFDAGGSMVFDSSLLEPRDGEGTYEGLSRAHLKHWCSAGQAAGGIYAAGCLQSELGLRADEIARLQVEVPASYAAMIDRPHVEDRIASMLSVQYGIALQLLSPDGLYDCARSSLLSTPDVLECMARVEVCAADDLEALHPTMWPARLTLTANDGRTAVFETADCRPDPTWSWDKVLDKARHVARVMGLALDAEALCQATRSFAVVEELQRALRAATGTESSVHGEGARATEDRQHGGGGERQSGVRPSRVPAAACAASGTIT